MAEIRENLEAVKIRIKAACERSGRSEQGVRLIAVSKTKPMEAMLEAYEAGVRDFGENYVQEILEKTPMLPKDARIHMIGHLQTNKVGKIIDKVCMIHSVDSERLLLEIEKQAKKHGLECVPVLLEVNVAKEESKFGFSEEEIDTVLSLAKAECPHVLVEGFMTSAPFTEDGTENRPYFKALKALSERHGLKQLSMGMTGDFETAVEEGASMIRVGTAIFGARDYSKKREGIYD